MAIRKRPGRQKPYEVYWRNPYTRKQESLYFSTRLAAEKENSAALHRLKYEKESFRPEDGGAAVEGCTVNQVISLYLADRKFSDDNLAVTLFHLKTITQTLGKKNVESLSKADIWTYMSAQKACGAKPLTLHRRLSILRAALAWAETEGIIQDNPIRGIKIPKGKPERIAPPTEAESEKLIQNADPHLARAIILALYLGVRFGPTELLSLKWADVDLERSVVRVWSAKKNPNMPFRDLPLRGDLHSMLLVWRAEDSILPAMPETIVHYKGKPVRSLKRTWRKCKEKAGIIRKLRPYDLRHAFATYALNAGADIKSVAEMMNHSDPRMILEHYQHTSEATKRQIVEALPCLSKMSVLTNYGNS